MSNEGKYEEIANIIWKKAAAHPQNLREGDAFIHTITMPFITQMISDNQISETSEFHEGLKIILERNWVEESTGIPLITKEGSRILNTIKQTLV